LVFPVSSSVPAGKDAALGNDQIPEQLPRAAGDILRTMYYHVSDAARSVGCFADCFADFADGCFAVAAA